MKTHSNQFRIFIITLIGFVLPVFAMAQTNNVSTDVSVYSAGYYKEGDKRFACYWKNGIRQALDLTGITKGSEATCITVANNSVYVAGYFFNNYNEIHQCYWKDGTLHDLGVLDGDVYYLKTFIVVK
jgi:uncharacterized membrane protein